MIKDGKFNKNLISNLEKQLEMSKKARDMYLQKSKEN